MPVAIYNSSKYSKLELWINIRENYLKGYVMTSSCRFPKYNLVQNRVYTIINAFEITSVLSDKDEPIKLIKLRVEDFLESFPFYEVAMYS